MEPELPEDVRPGLDPVDEEVDHARGPTAGRLILEYGDYECPYSRQAFRAIEYVEQELNGRVRFAFRHFPLVQIRPHAFGAAAAADVEVTLDITPRVPHVFQAYYPILDEAAAALDRAGLLLSAHLADAALRAAA